MKRHSFAVFALLAVTFVAGCKPDGASSGSPIAKPAGGGIAGIISHGPNSQTAGTDSHLISAPPNSSRSLSPTANQIELSAEKIQQIGELKYRATVEYRFSRGRPDSTRAYTILVQFVGAPYYENKQFAGADLKPNGTLEWEFQLPAVGGKPGSEPAEFTLLMSEEESREGKQLFVGKSNQLNGRIIP